MVNVPDDVVRPLLPEFARQTGRTAEIVYTGNDPFGMARDGNADLVLSHYGHAGVEPFVTNGLGLWPHAVFSNVMALVGPRDDPAKVRGLADLAEAFRRIALTKSPFVVNDAPGALYIASIAWTGAGVAPAGDWYRTDLNVVGPQAVQAAQRAGAYTLFGLPPFLRLKRQGQITLEPLVVADPLLQRMMVSIVVNGKQVPGARMDGALAFQNYLLASDTQARVRAFRYDDFDQQAWWPAGRHNNARE
jgi:tungstate transport system substrate-binding protein